METKFLEPLFAAALTSGVALAQADRPVVRKIRKGSEKLLRTLKQLASTLFRMFRRAPHTSFKPGAEASGIWHPFSSRINHYMGQLDISSPFLAFDYHYKQTRHP